MIKGELLGGQALVKRTEQFAPKLVGNLTQRIMRLSLTLQRNVKADKLTGQALKVRSGRLRRSINMRLTGQNTTTVSGIVGTNVVYARPHEYGFNGVVPVKASLRTIKQAWGKSITPVSVQVRAHSRTVHLPERSFLRSALADMQGYIYSEVNSAVLEAIK